MNSTTLDAESIVRQYLLFLEDPARLVDVAEVARLEAEAAAAKDPIEKLKSLAALARARTVDGEAFEQGFIGVARDWANENSIPAAMFAELGVPDSVLRTAGLERGARASSASRPRKTSSVRMTKSVSAKEIQKHIASRKGTFVLADIATSVGGSPMTIRKAVDGLVTSGLLTRIGPTPDWAGPGRAPIVFQLNK